MNKIIELLCEEHRTIEKLLVVLEQELAVFDRRERPDYDVLQAVIDYFEDFPERAHHPKEDLIFALLKARDPQTAATVAKLEADHRQGSQRLQRLANTVASILTDHELRRTTVDAVVRDFIDGERAHIEFEERSFFPAVTAALQPQDWVLLEARLSDRRDPLFNGAIDERFRVLQQRILSWEEENERARA
jgi:hemerythrin-like domain-containing protein